VVTIECSVVDAGKPNGANVHIGSVFLNGFLRKNGRD
jgi:hypothetical protein